jgi:uncharacterized protein YbaA (DUF1428 family)
MPAYVDGFVLLVPTENLTRYRKIAAKAGRIWREHGALQYVETIGDDLDTPFGRPFPKLAKPKDGETVVFSWILHKSKAERNKTNARVMKDPRLAAMGKEMPFDMKRMSWGGFAVLVDA